MAKPVLMATYHQAVLDALRQLDWVVDADDYPENATQLLTPAVYFSVMSWEQTPNADGQLMVELECDLYVVVDRACTEDIGKPQVYARSAAADLSNWIDGQQFGFEGLSPAEFVSAEPYAFDPAMDDYVVWRVNYTQTLALGEDPYETDAALLQEVWLGAAPEIGQAHIDDYRLIYKRKEDGDG